MHFATFLKYFKIVTKNGVQGGICQMVVNKKVAFSPSDCFLLLYSRGDIPR